MFEVLVLQFDGEAVQTLQTGATFSCWFQDLFIRGAPTPEGYDDLSSEVIAAASDIATHPGGTCQRL